MSNLKMITSTNQSHITIPMWILGSHFSLEEIGLFSNILDISATEKEFSQSHILLFIHKNDYDACNRAWIKLIEKGVLKVHPSKFGEPFYTVNHNWGEETV